MDHKLHLDLVYENNLDTDKFARMFNNKAQSYKFYWFEAILNLTKTSEEDLSFENVIDEMICEAWHTVTHYHLRLGPTVNGNAANFLEHAINTLNNTVSDLSQNPSKEELKQAISECEKELKRDKTRLTDYVPYKLLYPFFDVEGMEEELSYIKNDKHSRLIAYMAKLSGDENLFYTILDGVGLQKKIRESFCCKISQLFREMNGVNRIDDFVKMCLARGWLVQRLDIENQLDLYAKAEEEIEFE